MDEKKYEKAIEVYTEAIETKRDFICLYTNRALAYIKLLNAEGAEYGNLKNRGKSTSYKGLNYLIYVRDDVKITGGML